jgi:hypothetical protein
MTLSASQNLKTVTFSADWQTLNYFTLADAQHFHCIPSSLIFYQVKWCNQVSVAVNMDSRNSYPSFNHWRCKKKTPKFRFLCSSVTHLVYVYAFCDIHAFHVHGAYSCDRKLQHSRNTFCGLQTMHAIAFSTSIYTVLILLYAYILLWCFAHAWLPSRSHKVLKKILHSANDQHACKQTSSCLASSCTLPLNIHCSIPLSNHTGSILHIT